MSESGWLAVLAVVGTLLGSSISPIASAWRDRATARDNLKSERLRAVAELAAQLVDHARNGVAVVGISPTLHATTEKRFEVAKFIPAGEGGVDVFIEHVIEATSRQRKVADRIVVAEYGAGELLAWARGGKPASDLKTFNVVVFADSPAQIV